MARGPQAKPPVVEYGFEPGAGFYQKQYDCVYHDERFGIVEAGTKTGKTVSHLDWAVYKGLTSPGDGHFIYWIAPVYEQAQVAWERAPLIYPQPGFITERNSARLSFKLPNGCTFLCRTGDDDDRLYSRDVWAVVIDEASRLKNGAAVWKAVVSITTNTRVLGGGEVRIITNVRGKKNWAYRQARRAEHGASDWFYGELTADDAVAAGVLSQQTIDEAREEMPLEEFLELYYNQATGDEYNPFGHDAIDDCTRDADWAGEAPIVAWGLDFGRKRDWTFGVGLNWKGEVVDWFRTQEDWEVQKWEIKERVGHVPVLCDATGVGDAMVSALLGIGVDAREFIFSVVSREQLFRGLMLILRDRGLAIPESIITRQLRDFEYSSLPSGRLVYGAPEDGHADGVIGLALAVMMLREARGAAVGHRHGFRGGAGAGADAGGAP